MQRTSSTALVGKLATEETLEESATLGANRGLVLAALDPESDVDAVSLVSCADRLRSKLKVLLGARPEASKDVSQKRAEEKNDS